MTTSDSSVNPALAAFSLVQKTALVLGASRGIGAAIARALAASGANVVVASRDRAALESLAAELDPNGIRVRAIVTDMSDSATVEAAVQLAVASFGRLDIAINNAGIQNPRTPFTDIADNDFDRLITTNLRGVFVAMKHELRAMQRAGGGSIINIASVAGQVGLPLIAPYVASKHGVVGLTKAAAAEFADQNIRVNALLPGTVMTKMLKAGPLATPESTAAMLARIPMQRIADVDEITGTVIWLASAASSYVTGAVLPIDGGYTAV
jgi:NAD(P)-dependent dehydrogenase (short-subunit alcohol dehydrogenase family)